jgi:hypothetical protein
VAKSNLRHGFDRIFIMGDEIRANGFDFDAQRFYLETSWVRLESGSIAGNASRPPPDALSGPSREWSRATNCRLCKLSAPRR